MREGLKILGVDPGSRLTGYGCVQVLGRQLLAVEHGTLKLAKTSGKQEVPLEKRLMDLFLGLNDVIDRLKPQVLAVERVFFAKNAVSSLKLGQARGVVLVCGALKGLEVVEYSPTEVKRAVTGGGAAQKDQVARVLEMILGRQEFKTSDSSDALALAVCHALRGMMVSGALGAAPLSRRTSKTSSSLVASLGLTPDLVGDRRRVDFSKKS